MTNPNSTPEDEAPKARIAERWRRVGGYVAVAGLGAVALVLRQRAAGLQAEPEEEPGGRFRYVTHHAGADYVRCGHNCKKKANAYITSHDCCGKCHLGRAHARTEGADYQDPERHTFTGTLLHPGTCMSCGEPPEAHPWVYSRAYGTRYPSTD